MHAHKLLTILDSPINIMGEGGGVLKSTCASLWGSRSGRGSLLHTKWLTQWHPNVTVSGVKQNLPAQSLHPFRATTSRNQPFWVPFVKCTSSARSLFSNFPPQQIRNGTSTRTRSKNQTSLELAMAIKSACSVGFLYWRRTRPSQLCPLLSVK